MRYSSALILLLFAISSYSQSFSKSEIDLIASGKPNEPLEIYQTNRPEQHKVLLGKSQDISPKDKNLPILIDRMRASLASTDGGVGIAAPQVGINRNLVLAQRFDKPGLPVEYFINPKITWKSQVQSKGPEGDLSIDDFRDQFYRSYVIRLEYYDLQNKKHDEMLEGFTAVILQHEIDHLSGILIIDKLNTDKSLQYNDVKLYLKSKL